MTEDVAVEPSKSSRGKTAEVRSPDAWAKEKKPPAWAMAGAKQAMRDVWVIGRDITEADFDKAIADVMTMQFGSPAVPAKPRKKVLR